MSASFKHDAGSHHVSPPRKPARAFTILELLVVVGVVGLLIALLLPAVRTPGQAGLRSRCVNNLKQVMIGLYAYEAEHKALPPAYTVDARGRPLHSWRTLILPYIDQAALYQSIDLAKPWDDPANVKARETSLDVFQCPAADRSRAGMTSYQAIAGPDGCLAPDRPRPLSEITDGADKTIAVIEVPDADAVHWMAPADANESLVMRLGTNGKLHHPGGQNAGFIDGSVRFLKTSTPGKVLRALLTISGGEEISPNAY